MILKIFISPNCPNCPPAKKLGETIEKEKQKNLRVEFYDVSEVCGMAEGAYYSIQSTPSLILTVDDGVEIESWRGATPTLDEFFKKARDLKLKVKIKK